MRRVWSALESCGYQPAGDAESFRAGCPGHGGENREALIVSRAMHGGAVIYCYRGCDAKAILDALGLPWAALFPPGHKRAEKPKPRPAKTLSPGAAWLDAMIVAGFRWHAQLLGVECPYCSEPNAYITVHDVGGIDVECPNLCTERNVREAVETRAAIAEKGVQLR